MENHIIALATECAEAGYAACPDLTVEDINAGEAWVVDIEYTEEELGREMTEEESKLWWRAYKDTLLRLVEAE